MENTIIISTLDLINKSIKVNSNIDSNLVSDGYHTFGELYKHRIHLFIALCKAFNIMEELVESDYDYASDRGCAVVGEYEPGIIILKSKSHFDGSVMEGWFIIQLESNEGQISYHLPNEYWDKCEFIKTVDKANEWDGHTSDDVLERLLNL